MTTSSSGARRGGLRSALRSALRSKGAWPVGAVAAAILAFALLAEPAPARLSAMDPADGATVQAAPTAVTATFSGELATYDYHLSVAHEGGVTVTTGAVRRDGATLTVPVELTGTGTYLVAYHVRLADGVELSAVTRFGVGVPAAPVAGDPAAAAAAGHQHLSDDPMNLALLVLDAVLLVALAYALLRWGRRQHRP
ncbi:copper resistance CopC family protein [Dactylosporangium sp. NPDC005555]|uniref:copper resistance CopC family protein n=1 Tax=Dactylosporangium sp. NPDC005555 TaxID=3154889 RepID=UPI0033ACBFB2